MYLGVLARTDPHTRVSTCSASTSTPTTPLHVPPNCQTRVKRRLADGRSLREIATALGCSRSLVRQIRDGERLTHETAASSDPLWMSQLEWPVIIHELGLGHPMKFIWEERAKALITYLFRLNFVEQKSNAVFLGGVGLGKTHLCIALGHAACVRGYSVLFTTAIDIIHTLSAAAATGRHCAHCKASFSARPSSSV